VITADEVADSRRIPRLADEPDENGTNKLYRALRRGPVLVGEVRGFKSEVGRKFDKSDKNSPPIVFGVFKVHLEILSDGAPVMLSIYPDRSVNADTLGEQLGLKRGAIVAISVGKLEMRDGQRRAVCAVDGLRVLDEEEIRRLQVA
jgi:hypothetical protein